MKETIVLLLLSVIAFGQTEPSPPSPSVTFDTPATPAYTVKCYTVENAPGCQSFNEMVLKKDKDVISYISGDYHSYVCFEKNADTFIVIATYPPLDGLYSKLPSSPLIEQQPSRMLFMTFKQGVNDQFQYVGGIWKKSERTGEIFTSPAGADPTVSITDAEISVEHSFQNLNKARTHYNFTLRLSTLRFVETWRVPSTKDKAADSLNEGGHCAEFKPTSS